MSMRWLVVAVAMAMAAPAAAQPIDRVVAVVNQAMILDSELALRLANVPDPVHARAAVLDDLVNEELVVQAGEQLHLRVAPAEVDAAIATIEAQNHLDDAGLRAALAAQHVTLDTYRTELRRQILRLRTIETVVAPKVTDRRDMDRQTHAWLDELRRDAYIEIEPE
jgi:peptidyl-prolyl cis-trans isomerase SurA